MDYILEKELKPEIFVDKYNYFFTFLNDRFEYAVKLWAIELGKMFKKEFKPIWVLSAKQNELFKKDNYILINNLIHKYEDRHAKLICQEEPEDLNKYFSDSKFVKELVDKLIAKQGKVFVLPWTTCGLNMGDKQVIILGPNPKISEKYDNKVMHIELFNKLDLPRNDTCIYNTFEQLKREARYPFFVSAACTSGGCESGVIISKEKLDEYYAHVREENKQRKFISARLIEDAIHSPNVNAIVYKEGKTEVVCISDQILRGCKYLGNIYPTQIDEKSKKAIIETTKKIGNQLATEGFRGLFGLDFIIDSKKNLYTTDLNPRRQGGYLVNILMALPKINLVELELKLALNKEIDPLPVHEDFQVDYVWAHSKLKPYYDFMQITKITNVSEPNTPFEKIGTGFKTIFYPEGYRFFGGCLGYIIKSGHDYNQVKKSLLNDVEETLSTYLDLYTI